MSFATCVLAAVAVQGWIALGAHSVMGSSDSMNYLLLADFYHGSFGGAATPAATEVYREARFPPLFPLLLGALGAGSKSQPLAYLISAACAVLSVALAWAWARAATASSAAATVVALALALNPGFFLLSLNPMSEPLAMALYLGALLAAPGVPSGGARLRCAALLAGMATLARSGCVALVAAWFAWSARGRPGWRPATGSLLLAGAPLTLWMLHRQDIAGAESYLQSLDPRLILAQLGGWPDLLILQPHRMLNAFVRCLAPAGGPLPFAAGTLIAVLALAGCAVRCRQNALDAWFLAAYLAVLFVWPYPKETGRLLVFILPLVLVGAHEGARRLLGRWQLPGAARLATALLAMLVLLASAATLGGFARRAALALDPELTGHAREQVYFLAPDPGEAVRAIERIASEYNTVLEAARHVGATECVYAVEPALLRLHAGLRAVRYPLTLDETRPAERQLARCRYFFVSAAYYEGAGYASFHLADRISAFTEPVLVARLDQGEGPVAVAALLVLRSSSH